MNCIIDNIFDVKSCHEILRLSWQHEKVTPMTIGQPTDTKILLESSIAQLLELVWIVKM